MILLYIFIKCGYNPVEKFSHRGGKDNKKSQAITIIHN